jgi:magnesium-transporting ATPase (P-type)
MPTQFVPQSNHTYEALYGVGISDIQSGSSRIGGKKLHPPSSNKGKIGAYVLVIVVISAVIFVTIVALYDVVKTYISNIFASRALKDPVSTNSLEDILQAEVANREALNATLVFALFCVITFIIMIVLILIWNYRNKLVNRTEESD